LRNFRSTEWYGFEHEAWACGEKIRQLLKSAPKLKKDSEIQDGIIAIVNSKNLRRGRQSFALLLGNLSCKHLHQELVKHLKDEDINGHVLD
jgi:hypothetical protein